MTGLNEMSEKNRRGSNSKAKTTDRFTITGVYSKGKAKSLAEAFVANLLLCNSWMVIQQQSTYSKETVYYLGTPR